MDFKIILVTRNRPEHFALIDALQETLCLKGAILQTDDAPTSSNPEMIRYNDDLSASISKFFGRKFSHSSNIPTLAVEGKDINSHKTISFINDLGADLLINFDTTRFTKESLEQIKCEKWGIHKGYIAEFKGYNCHFWANYLLKPSNTCCTLHRLIDDMNNGDIIHQTGIKLRAEDSVQDSSNRALRTFINDITDIVAIAKNGKLKYLPQPEIGKFWRNEEMMPEHIKSVYNNFNNRVSKLSIDGALTDTPIELFKQNSNL